MTKLTILVDMDDTIENFCEVWVDLINKHNGTNVSINDIKDWDITKAFPTLDKESIYAPILTEELWKRVTPLPGAVEYLKKIIDDGHRVVIVTALSHHETISTKFNNVLFKYFPYITLNDVVVTSQKQIVRGDILIDDAPHNLEGGDYLKLLYNAPHNMSYPAEQNDMIRVESWSQIYDIVCDIAERRR